MIFDPEIASFWTLIKLKWFQTFPCKLFVIKSSKMSPKWTVSSISHQYYCPFLLSSICNKELCFEHGSKLKDLVSVKPVISSWIWKCQNWPFLTKIVKSSNEAKFKSCQTKGIRLESSWNLLISNFLWSRFGADPWIWIGSHKNEIRRTSRKLWWNGNLHRNRCYIDVGDGCWIQNVFMTT